MERLEGTVVKWVKDFGFIRPDAQMADIFVHFSEIDKGVKGFKNLIVGDRVTFEIGKNPRQEDIAINVEIIRGAK